MSLSQMEVFNKYFMPATIETLGQMTDKFNASSGGALQLNAANFEGDFEQSSFYQAVHSAKRRVNRYGTNDPVTPTELQQLKNSSVKVAGGFGPILGEPSQFTWMLKPTTEMVAMASQNFAEALLEDQLNTAIASLVAAIENQAAATNDVSGSGGVNYSELNNAHALFGDASSSIVANVMTGQVFHKLIGQNLTNTNRLFLAGNISIVDWLGKFIVVTDSPSLLEAGTPTKQKVLGLVSGAVTISDSSDIIANVETNNRKQRIEQTYQADYTFNVGLKGYTWDTVNGGASPTDAALATGSNWDKTATDIKHTAGVITIGDAAQN